MLGVRRKAYASASGDNVGQRNEKGDERVVVRRKAAECVNERRMCNYLKIAERINAYFFFKYKKKKVARVLRA